MTAIAVIYYSATGSVHRLAEGVAAGARAAGAEVRLRRVAELAPEDAIQANPAWAEHRLASADVPEVSLEDLRWADGFALGTPTRFGNPSAQLKQFIDTTSGLWRAGELANKAATSFTSSRNVHGGQESTILALNNVLYHWGAVIVPPGYTHDAVSAAGGNPYGTSWASSLDPGGPDAATIAAARYQGHRLARITTALTHDRARFSAFQL